MALVIRWTAKAARQLEAAVDYIARDSERYARAFAVRVVRTVESIPACPFAGRIVPEFGKVDLREKICLGYRVVYRLTPEAVEILALCHGARLIEHALDEE